MKIKNMWGFTDEEYQAHKKMGFIVDFDYSQVVRLQKLMAEGMTIKEIAEQDAERAHKKAQKDKKL